MKPVPGASERYNRDPEYRKWVDEQAAKMGPLTPERALRIGNLLAKAKARRLAEEARVLSQPPTDSAHRGPGADRGNSKRGAEPGRPGMPS